MGLRNSVFWLAHGLTYLLVQMLVTWGMVGVLFAIQLARSSSVLVLWFLILSFGVTLILLSFLFSAFFRKARSAGGNAMFLTLIFSTPFMALQYVDLARWQLLCFSIVSPMVFCIGMDTVWSFEGAKSLFCVSLWKKPNVCQDRLGINTGKVEKRRLRRWF